MGIEFRLGRRADGLDTDARTVSLDDGTDLYYDGLIIATGAHARALPGTEDVPGVHTLRTLDDAEALIADLAAAGAGAHVVVIGAGFIGSEVAATLSRPRVRGHPGRGPAHPARSGPRRPRRAQPVPHCVTLDAGVALRTGVGVDRVVAETGAGSGTAPISVHLDDGDVLSADVVVVGIGVAPAVDWLAGSGLLVDDGVVCDEALSPPNE